MTRRDWLRLVVGSCGIFITMPLCNTLAAVQQDRQTLLDEYLGEELYYKIGFGFISHCGDAITSVVKTDLPGIYRLSLRGHTVGFIDFLVGPLLYSYVSYAYYSAEDHRLRPVVFQMIRERSGKERRRSVVYDYAARQILFSKTGHEGETRVQREPMTPGRIYEDYLTLSYNFRHGNYGVLKQGTLYQLPLYIRKKMKSLKLEIVDEEQKKKQRRKEAIQKERDFFLKFQVDRQDVSSGSGAVEAWLSSGAVPVKGRIKDVIFFGDLYGELIEKRAAHSHEIAAIPDSIKNRIRIP